MKSPLVAIIPARSGSKGLTNKNILTICNKPLVAFTIEAAKKSGIFDYVIISTDSEEINQIAQDYGAVSLGIRPSFLATDDSLALDTYLYTIDLFNYKFGFDASTFFVLQPTSPLRNERHIQEAWELFNQGDYDSLISVARSKYPIEWALTLKQDRFIEHTSKLDLKNRQEMDNYYYPNGSIFILKHKLLIEHRTYYYSNSVAYIMDSINSIDIDDSNEFELARLIIQNRLANVQ